MQNLINKVKAIVKDLLFYRILNDTFRMKSMLKVITYTVAQKTAQMFACFEKIILV